MTTINIPATTLNFDEDGFLLKSEFMGFTVVQQFKEESYPDTYVAYQEELQFSDKTLGDLLDTIIEHHYDKALK